MSERLFILVVVREYIEPVSRADIRSEIVHQIHCSQGEVSPIDVVYINRIALYVRHNPAHIVIGELEGESWGRGRSTDRLVRRGDFRTSDTRLLGHAPQPNLPQMLNQEVLLADFVIIILIRFKVEIAKVPYF